MKPRTAAPATVEGTGRSRWPAERSTGGFRVISRIETVVATSGTTATAFNTRMVNFGTAFNDLDLADTEISANITFNIGNGTRIDCADPSMDGQPATTPCFDPALRTAAP